MTVWESLWLGILQGITEFLPVSSDGHLAVASALMNIGELSPFFTVVVHFATLLAIIIFFWQDILALRFKDWLLLAVATIPAGIFGIAIHGVIGDLLNNPVVAGLGLLVTGCVNWYIYSIQKNRQAPAFEEQKPKYATFAEWWKTFMSEKVFTVSYMQVFIIGCFQAIAILPGVSRSGFTVAGSLWSKLNIEKAFKLSFIMAVPAILGATGLELLLNIMDGGLVMEESVASLFVGAVSAGLVGFFCLRLLKIMAQRNYFNIFAYYCWTLGAVVVLFVK